MIVENFSKYENIIFDLDGTLIDSASSILEALAYTLKINNVPPLIELTNDLVGPPLKDTLKVITGVSNPQDLEVLACGFKDYYDSEGYKNCTPFPGITKLLQCLLDEKKKIYVATNKRTYPTAKIINALCWKKYFVTIYSIDSFDIVLSSKTKLVEHVIKKEKLERDKSIYIGDRDDDEDAAIINNIHFLKVKY